VFGYDSGNEILHLLKDWFERYEKGSLQVDPAGIEKYSRRELTRKLAKELLWE